MPPCLAVDEEFRGDEAPHPISPDVSLQRNTMLNSFEIFVENMSAFCCKVSSHRDLLMFKLQKMLLSFMIIVENISIICCKVISHGEHRCSFSNSLL
jgi:hypothetical protein